ncbi:MAG: nitroreductase family deazaflavin-dependent oxidoreductase [Actinomycetota bacterium]|uniref:Nitroreductase family deazaflavin-dependent oxidoreductase n=1 Tax=Mycobacterium lentiflavum TaxID=141349 RepID=A0ABY3UZY9_MYCLN|nr:nitroreductase family deazaflavin-dependent oxidoreductase [Mycobacterium lentiflavum]MEE3065505.1 nitroreductase family deazaflavin-dependent oxidoreductase [Actinomycetota bacterium]ULP42540.1 nitroreductase family deazaflavin-dependent oxidoreductase [Mycobacterium lentiflavum]
MRVPRAVANFNRRVTNPAARSITPWLPCLGTLEHVGRKSGKHYRTPLLVFKTRDGFAILIGYGPETDWLKNVLAGGPTVLRKRGKAIALANPRVVSKAEAADLVTPPSRLYRLFPYNEAALVLTNATHSSGP